MAFEMVLDTIQTLAHLTRIGHQVAHTWSCHERCCQLVRCCPQVDLHSLNLPNVCGQILIIDARCSHHIPGGSHKSLASANDAVHTWSTTSATCSCTCRSRPRPVSATRSRPRPVPACNVMARAGRAPARTGRAPARTVATVLGSTVLGGTGIER